MNDKYDKSKVSNSPETVLVQIKNKLSDALELTPNKLKMLIDKFVRENTQALGSKVHHTRTNTYNEFTTPKMTIKVFFKFLRFIDLQSVTFRVKVRTKTGREVEIEQFVNLARHSAETQDKFPDSQE